MGFAGDPKFTRVVGGPVSFYQEYTTTTLYVERAMGGDVNELVMTNDSETDTIQVSWDGATLEGDIKAGETLTLKTTSRSSVYVKATTGGENVRIWAW